MPHSHAARDIFCLPILEEHEAALRLGSTNLFVGIEFAKVYLLRMEPDDFMFHVMYQVREPSMFIINLARRRPLAIAGRRAVYSKMGELPKKRKEK